jgi:8-oxo-dGTP pyrophosphatase MutT (NUDIX family)
MYKVFFKDRTVFFSDDFPETFRTKNGLFYKYESRDNLVEIISAFFRLEKISTLYLFHNDLEVLRKDFNSFFQPVKAAGGLVRNPEDQFLVILRNEIWDLPKGKAEKKETSSETALREVSEECGIKSPELKDFLIKTFHAYMQSGKPMLKETDWYNMSVESGIKTTPQKKENITEIRWVNKESASEIESNTFPLILEVLKAAKLL